MSAWKCPRRWSVAAPRHSKRWMHGAAEHLLQRVLLWCAVREWPSNTETTKSDACGHLKWLIIHNLLKGISVSRPTSGLPTSQLALFYSYLLAFLISIPGYFASIIIKAFAGWTKWPTPAVLRWIITHIAIETHWPFKRRHKDVKENSVMGVRLNTSFHSTLIYMLETVPAGRWRLQASRFRGRKLCWYNYGDIYLALNTVIVF